VYYIVGISTMLITWSLENIMKKTALSLAFAGISIVTNPMAFGSENSNLLEACMARMLEGDKTAYTDCYTEDFKLDISETKLMNEAGYLIGREAVDALADMFKTDAAVMDRTTRVVTQLEGKDVIMREVEYLMIANPDKPGYVENGETSLGRHLSMFRFKDGKISEEFTPWNMLGFLLDLNDRDFEKTGEMVSTLGSMQNRSSND
jgi:hypothetical protein